MTCTSCYRVHFHDWKDTLEQMMDYQVHPVPSQITIKCFSKEKMQTDEIILNALGLKKFNEVNQTKEKEGF